MLGRWGALQTTTGGIAAMVRFHAEMLLWMPCILLTEGIYGCCDRCQMVADMHSRHAWAHRLRS